jgi:hypothetical protein
LIRRHAARKRARLKRRDGNSGTMQQLISKMVAMTSQLSLATLRWRIDSHLQKHCNEISNGLSRGDKSVAIDLIDARS